jgi:hypothetical protein
MEISMRHRHRIARFFAAAIAAVLAVGAATPALVPAARAAELAEFTATYRVMVGSSVVGEFQATLERDGDRYTLTATTRPNMLARLFGGDRLTETNVFRIDGNVVRPLDYRVTRDDKGESEEHALFDWESGQVRQGDGTSAIPAGGLIEAGVYPVSLMVNEGQDLGGRDSYVFDGDRVRRYRYLPPRQETVDTGNGEVMAIRIEKQRVDRDDRSIVVWLQPARHHLPVRIEQHRKNRITVLELTETSLPG